MQIAYLTATGIIFAVSITLIFWKHYDDGVVGKIALGVMMLASAATLVAAYDGQCIVPRPQDLWTLVGCALFLARHIYRFICFTFFNRFTWRDGRASAEES